MNSSRPASPPCAAGSPSSPRIVASIAASTGGQRPVRPDAQAGGAKPGAGIGEAGAVGQRRLRHRMGGAQRAQIDAERIGLGLGHDGVGRAGGDPEIERPVVRPVGERGDPFRQPQGFAIEGRPGHAFLRRGELAFPSETMAAGGGLYRLDPGIRRSPESAEEHRESGLDLRPDRPRRRHGPPARRGRRQRRARPCRPSPPAPTG